MEHTQVPSGIPIQDAFRRWSEQDDLILLDALGPYSAPPYPTYPRRMARPLNYHKLHKQWQDCRTKLEAAFVSRLITGQLVATGISLPYSVFSRRQLVPAHLWEVLVLDIEHGEAKVRGLHLSKLEVFETAAAGPSESEDSEGAAEGEFIHNEDYSVVQLRGQEFFFSRNQRTLIKILHEASPLTNPWVYGPKLMEDAGYASMFVGDAFKHHGNWKHLINSSRRGFYRLNLTRPAPELSEPACAHGEVREGS